MAPISKYSYKVNPLPPHETPVGGCPDPSLRDPIVVGTLDPGRISLVGHGVAHGVTPHRGRNARPRALGAFGALAGSDGGAGGMHLSKDLFAALSLKHRQVVLALKVEPETRAVAKVTAKPQRRVSGDRPASVQDVGDATGRHAKVTCQPVGPQSSGFELALEQSARMRNRIHSRNLPTYHEAGGYRNPSAEGGQPPRRS